MNPNPVNVPRPMHKELFPIDKFEGKVKDAAKVDQFVARLHDWIEMHHLTRDHDKILLGYRVFPIGSPAATWFQQQKLEDFESFETFIAAFRARFGMTAASKDLLLVRLKNFRQRREDDVAMYFANLSTLYDQLHQLKETFTASQKITQFVTGLRGDIQTFLAGQRVATPNLTLDQLVHYSIHYEQAASVTKRTSLNFIGKDRRKFRGTRPLPPTISADANIKQVVSCAFCKKAGHTWDECRKIEEKKRNGTWVENPRSSRSASQGTAST
jgi:hypothetical protein